MMEKWAGSVWGLQLGCAVSAVGVGWVPRGDKPDPKPRAQSLDCFFKM